MPEEFTSKDCCSVDSDIKLSKLTQTWRFKKTKSVVMAKSIIVEYLLFSLFIPVMFKCKKSFEFLIRL